MTDSGTALATVRAFERYYAVLNRRDPDGFADVLSPDVVFDDDALRRADVRGADAVTGLFTVIWQAIPDLTFSILAGPFFAYDSAHCMVHLRLNGILVEPMPAFGRTKIGGHMDLDCMALYEVRDDRVARVRVCCDPGVLDEQLGSINAR